MTHYYGSDRVSDRGQVLLARIFIIAIVAITYGLSLFPQRGVFGLGVWCFSGFASLFPLVCAAIYWRRLTKAGAFAGILTTILVWSLLFWKSGFGANSHYAVSFSLGNATFSLTTNPVTT